MGRTGVAVRDDARVAKRQRGKASKGYFSDAHPGTGRLAPLSCWVNFMTVLVTVCFMM